MRRFIWSIAVTLVLASLTIPARAGCKTDKDLLQGTWELVAVEIAGKGLPDKPKETFIIFKGDKVTKREAGKDDEANYKLEAARKPKEIDILAKKETVKGIYELQGDALKLAFSLKDQSERPKAFTGDVVVMTLKKRKG